MGDESLVVRANLIEMRADLTGVQVADSFIWINRDSVQTPFRRRRTVNGALVTNHLDACEDYVPMLDDSDIIGSPLILDDDRAYFCGVHSGTEGLGYHVYWCSQIPGWVRCALTVDLPATVWNAVYENGHAETDLALLPLLHHVWDLVCIVQRYLLLFSIGTIRKPV